MARGFGARETGAGFGTRRSVLDEPFLVGKSGKVRLNQNMLSDIAKAATLAMEGSSPAQVKALSEEVKAIRQTYESNKEKYVDGLIGEDELLSTEKRLFEAERRLGDSDSQAASLEREVERKINGAFADVYEQKSRTNDTQAKRAVDIELTKSLSKIITMPGKNEIEEAGNAVLREFPKLSKADLDRVQIKPVGDSVLKGSSGGMMVHQVYSVKKPGDEFPTNYLVTIPISTRINTGGENDTKTNVVQNMTTKDGGAGWNVLEIDYVNDKLYADPNEKYMDYGPSGWRAR